MTVPYSFANATVSIPLSQLDSNFNTPITLGNTAIQLGNTVTTLNNMTLANVTISSGNVTITNVSVTTANVTTLNATTVIATTANVTTANITTGNVTTANIVTANITTGNVTNMTSGNVAITGGSINGTTLGASTASTANVTTLTTSSTVTINGGTANGVAYLDGSKVLTTGSALTYNGSGLLQIGAGTGTQQVYVSGGGYDLALGTSGGALFGFASGAISGVFNTAAVPLGIGTIAAQPVVFGVGNTEQMRLTSTGLGIGTSSPASKLHLYTAAGATTLTVDSGNSGTALNYSLAGVAKYTAEYVSGSDFYAIGRSGVAYDLILKSGNLGIGTTSPANYTNYKTLTLNGSSGGAIELQNNGTTTALIFCDSQLLTIRGATSTPIVFQTNGATERARIPAAGGMVVGTAALATTATDGFLYVPTCAGTPTGTATTQTGTAPIVVDTTNNKLYFYSGGQWRDAGP